MPASPATTLPALAPTRDPPLERRRLRPFPRRRSPLHLREAPSSATQPADKHMDSRHRAHGPGEQIGSSAATTRDPDAWEACARGKQEGNPALAIAIWSGCQAVQPSVQPIPAGWAEMSAQQKQLAQLKRRQAGAGRQVCAAMAIYHQIFAQPHRRDWSLVYYETESATDEGRPHAIAGLQSLAKISQRAALPDCAGTDSDYNRRRASRAQGPRALSAGPAADEALRQSLLWIRRTGLCREIRAYLAKHPNPQLAEALQRRRRRSRSRTRARRGADTVRSQQNSSGRPSAQSAAESRHTRRSRQAHRPGGGAVQGVLERDPPTRVLCGMGYIRMQQGNFLGAISFWTGQAGN